MENSFVKDHICAKSRVSNIVKELLDPKYDVAIIPSGWDKRCLSILKAKFRCRNSIFITYKKADNEGYQKKHDEKLMAFCKKISDIQNVLIIDTLDLDVSWQKISEILINIKMQYKHPIKILISYSTFPRYYALGLLNLCLRYFMISEIHFFYAEAKYPGIECLKPEGYELSEGKWSVTPIPGYTGIEHASKKRVFHISVGFEGNKTRQVVLRKDPDRISILFPDPGYLKNYAKITYKSNKKLFEDYNIDNSKILRAKAGDAIEAWKIIEDKDIEYADDESTYYLACGNKPHALAYALKAFRNKYPTMLYKVPEKFTPLIIEDTGLYWVYRIVDLSIPKEK